MRYRVIAKYNGRSAEDYVIQPNLNLALSMARLVVRSNAMYGHGGKYARECWTNGEIVLIDENLDRHPLTMLRVVENPNVLQ